MNIYLPQLPDKTSRIIKKNILKIIYGYAPKKIILYGSYARGDYHDGSDLDLILIKDTQEKFADRIEQVMEFCDGRISVAPLVYSEEEIRKMISGENILLNKAFEEGIVVYEQKS